MDGKGNMAGGFVGHVYKTSMTMTIVNSTNNGPITGFSLMGGFVGFFRAAPARLWPSSTARTMAWQPGVTIVKLEGLSVALTGTRIPPRQSRTLSTMVI